MRPIVDKAFGEEGYRLFFNRPVGGKLFEAPMQICVHCNSRVIMNPLRKRPRGHCRKCDDYVCDDIACNIRCWYEK